MISLVSLLRIKLSLFSGKLDVIISDMAADTTGSKSLDSIRTNQLCSEALFLSSKILKPKGVFVSKLFMGEDFIEVKKLAKSLFKVVNFLNLFQAEKNLKRLIYTVSFKDFINLKNCI